MTERVATCRKRCERGHYLLQGDSSVQEAKVSPRSHSNPHELPENIFRIKGITSGIQNRVKLDHAQQIETFCKNKLPYSRMWALNQIRKTQVILQSYIVLVRCFHFVTYMQSTVVLSGQVKQYFACESQHQHGAFDMFFFDVTFVGTERTLLKQCFSQFVQRRFGGRAP